MKRGITILALFLALGVSVTSCKPDKKEVQKEEVAAAVYQCPMDCENGKTYEKEGTCPVCKMDLKKKVSEVHTEDHSGHNH